MGFNCVPRKQRKEILLVNSSRFWGREPRGGGLLDVHYWSERGGDEEAGRNKNVKRMLDEKQKGICVCSCTFLGAKIFFMNL